MTTYARSLHNVTVHRAVGLDPDGPAACGAVPRRTAWRGQDEWRFYDAMPAPEGAWEGVDPETLLCKRCFRSRKRKGATR